MPEPKTTLDGAAPLSIPQLESGLRLLGSGDIDDRTFWDANVDAFRQTLLFAIRETSDALLSPAITQSWRAELESQLEDLIGYIQIAERYIARRSSARSGSASLRGRTH